MKTVLYPHRLWIGLLLLAATLFAISRPLIARLEAREQTRLEKAQAERERLDSAIRQLRNDMAETERLNAQIGTAEADRVMAPADRLRAAHMVETKAAAYRLSEMVYGFAPEEAVKITPPGNELAEAPQSLAQSRVTITATAPVETDGWRFLDALRRNLPGRFDLRSLSVIRIDADKSDTAVKAGNIRMTAEGDWLSNGAASDPTQTVKTGP